MIKEFLSNSYHDLMYKNDDHYRHLSDVREKLRAKLLAPKDYDPPRAVIESDIERIEKKMSGRLRICIYNFLGKPTF